MVEVHDIRIISSPPGRHSRYICDIRLIDRSKGTSVSEHGFTVWNWDKAISFEGWYLASMSKRAGRVITKALCS